MSHRKRRLQHAPRLSARIGNDVYFKREDLQPIFSFKLRGAYNRMAHLTPEERERGVITASAGNHAQGVAFSGQKLGMRTVIVMPVTTPAIKVNACRARGAEIVLHGDSYSDAEAHAYRLQSERGLIFVHPYDDPLVIAGQGTIGLELARQISGTAVQSICADRRRRFDRRYRCVPQKPLSRYPDHRRRTRRFGCHVSERAAARARDAARGRHLRRWRRGAARRRSIPSTWCEQYVDDFIQVDTDEVCAAIKDVFEDTRAIQEPAGALAVAGLKRYAAHHELQGER